MSAVGNAFKTMGEGIGHAFQGVGKTVAGVCTLDFKKAGEGIGDISHGIHDTTRGALDLTPVGLAANECFDGALDNTMKDGFAFVDDIGDKVVGTLGTDLDMVKDGVVDFGEGIAHGDLGESFQGLMDAGIGAVSVVSDITPGGVAFNAGMATLEKAGLDPSALVSTVVGGVVGGGEGALAAVADGEVDGQEDA